MHTYECKTCKKTVEIEEYEAVFGDNEAYEFDQCRDCFGKS